MKYFDIQSLLGCFVNVLFLYVCYILFAYQRLFRDEIRYVLMYCPINYDLT